MKKITLLLLLLTVSFGYAQSSPVDFESDVITGVNWVDFGVDVDVEDDTTPTAPANGKVGRLLTIGAGNPWQEAHLIMTTSAIDLTTATGGTKIISVDIYSTTGNDYLLKALSGFNGAGNVEVGGAHDGTGWETVEFDFNNGNPGAGGVPDGKYGELAFFPLYDISGGLPGGFIGSEGMSPVTTTYIDNVTFVEAAFPAPDPTCDDGILNQEEEEIDCGGPNCSPCATPPTTAAPTPPARDPADVSNIYSEAYAPKTFNNFSAGWCGNPAVAEETIDGGLTMRYLGLPCQGIDFSSSRLDLSTFTHLHFDFYTDETDLIGKVFKFKFVDFAGGGAEASNFEINFTDGSSPAVIGGTWVSVDIDLTSGDPIILGSLTRSDIAQIGLASNLQNAWYDNLYFHKNTVLGTDDFDLASFKVYPNPAKDSWTVKTKNQEIASIQVYDILGKSVLSLSPNASEAKIDGSTLTTGLYFAQIKTANGVKSVKLVKQ